MTAGDLGPAGLLATVTRLAAVKGWRVHDYSWRAPSHEQHYLDGGWRFVFRDDADNQIETTFNSVRELLAFLLEVMPYGTGRIDGGSGSDIVRGSGGDGQPVPGARRPDHL